MLNEVIDIQLFLDCCIWTWKYKWKNSTFLLWWNIWLTWCLIHYLTFFKISDYVSPEQLLARRSIVVMMKLVLEGKCFSCGFFFQGFNKQILHVYFILSFWFSYWLSCLSTFFCSKIWAVNSLLEGIHLVASVEAIYLGVRAGLHPMVLYDIISNAAGSSW